MVAKCKKIPNILFGIFSLGIIVFSKGVGSDYGRAERLPIAPPQHLEKIVFGFQEGVADTLWIRAIQDFDYCDKPLNNVGCKNNSWLFQMLDSITNLSPKFRIVYLDGPLALSIVISDIQGASKLFDKAVMAYPNDWRILYGAAYQAIYEEKDKKKAGDLLIRAGQNGAPEWVFSLANRLYADSGNIELAEALLKDMVDRQQDPKLIERMRQKIESIKKSTH